MDELRELLDEQGNRLAQLRANIKALAAGWRNDWSDFDGRMLQTQINQILEGENTGLAFYHERRIEGDPPCGWYCPLCEGEKRWWD
jgi:hypothetical protein